MYRLPAIGGVARVYVVQNISITGEFTKFKLPENLVRHTRAHYVDFDLYGTVNLSENIGAQIGYRSLDIWYVVDTDTSTFTLRRPFSGVVAGY